MTLDLQPVRASEHDLILLFFVKYIISGDKAWGRQVKAYLMLDAP